MIFWGFILALLAVWLDRFFIPALGLSFPLAAFVSIALALMVKRELKIGFYFSVFYGLGADLAQSALLFGILFLYHAAYWFALKLAAGNLFAAAEGVAHGLVFAAANLFYQAGLAAALALSAFVLSGSATSANALAAPLGLLYSTLASVALTLIILLVISQGKTLAKRWFFIRS